MMNDDSGQKTLYLRILRSSPQEAVYRARRALTARAVKLAAAGGMTVPRIPPVDMARVRQLETPRFDIRPESGLIAQILNGKRFLLQEDGAESAADPRMLWEPARLQHLTYLLACASERPDDAPALRQAAVSMALQWLDGNPFPRGPHYASPMECGLRIPVFFYCLKVMDDPRPEAARALAGAIYRHAWWVEKRLSLYSSLGNHTICECVGLLFAGAVFRNTGAGRRWLSRGVEILKREVRHQVLDDGGPAEQSLAYHRFVLDLYRLAADFMERNGIEGSAALKPGLLSGERFLAAFEDRAGNLPDIGDSDDGHAVAPGVRPKKEKAVEKDPGEYRHFPDAGYTVIHTDAGLRFTFDHGPLGMPPLFNHGHADALSVTLSVCGRDILVDPGTYRYNGAPKWRSYFKSTRAHSTVTIDGADQAVQETGFIWSNPYECEPAACGTIEDGFLMESVHTGYRRLNPPVAHRRSILFSNRSTFTIRDTFEGEGAHDFELNFHFHPDVKLVRQGRGWSAENAGSRIFMGLTGEDEFHEVRGLESPLLGWFSPAYGARAASSVLTCRKKGHPCAVNFLTVISLTLPTIEHVHSGKAGELWKTGSRF